MKNPIEDIADLDTHYDNDSGGDCPAAPCSADFDAERKAIEFQELFFPKAGKLVRTAVRFSFAQGFRIAQKQNDQDHGTA